MSAEWPEGWEEALGGDAPTAALRGAVVDARSSGGDKDALLRQLGALRAHLAGSAREDDEDVVLEVMDFLAGWSGPHMRID